MAKNIKKQLETTEKLHKENKELQQKLLAAKEAIDAIKSGRIDALVFPNKNDIKVYTETTADKTYRVLIEKMHEGAVTLNEKGIILYCNSYFANMISLKLQNVIGTKFESYIAVSSKKQFDILLKKGWKSNAKNELEIKKKNGKSIPVHMSVNTLTLDKNSVLSIIITDLTVPNKNKSELNQKAIELEQKNQELNIVNKELAFQNNEKEKRSKELNLANQDLITFTYVSSHDIQEPLRKIRNFISVLLDEEQERLSDEGKIYLQGMYETAKGMQALIEDLLTYARAKEMVNEYSKKPIFQ